MATEYVLLCKQRDVGWMEVTRLVASSGSAALRATVAEYQPPAQDWVAVPARSWKPVTVKVETKTALRFS